jgi:hypothetical protein
MPESSPRRRLASLDALAGALGERSPEEVDWPPVIELAGQLDVTAALWARRSSELERLPPPAAEALRVWGRGNTIRNARLRRQLCEVVEALAREGIETLLLKGSVRLVDGSLRFLGERWLTDLDLVVPADRAAAGRAALERADYIPLPDKPFEHPHELPYMRARRPGPVEIHVELGSPPVPQLLPVSEAWQRSVPIEFDGLRARMLPPTLQVFHNVLHSAVQDLNHAVGGLPLRQLTDLVSLVRAHQAEIDWSEIHSRMAAGQMEAVLAAHLWLAHRYAGMPLPSVPWCRPARRHELWVRAGFALGWPADLQRNLRYAFGRRYLDSLYGHGDRALSLAAARTRHAWRLARVDARGALAQARRRRG